MTFIVGNRTHSWNSASAAMIALFARFPTPCNIWKSAKTVVQKYIGSLSAKGKIRSYRIVSICIWWSRINMVYNYIKITPATAFVIKRSNLYKLCCRIYVSLIIWLNGLSLCQYFHAKDPFHNAIVLFPIYFKDQRYIISYSLREMKIFRLKNCHSSILLAIIDSQ